MLIIGEEVYFKAGNLPSSCILSELYLKYMGFNQTGVKFKGHLPHLWEFGEGQVTGPYLYNQSGIFKVMKIDYNRHNLWLRGLASDFHDNNLENPSLTYGFKELDLAGNLY